MIPQTSYIGSWMQCFQGSIRKGNSNVRRTLLGAGLQMFQQLTGINFIFYFGPVFFNQIKNGPDPFRTTLVTTLVNVLSTPLSFWTIEKFGRRLLLLFGAVGMVIAQYIVAILGATAGKEQSDGSHNEVAIKAMIAFICINIFSFATTWGPVGWVTVGESFPLPIRSRGVGISTASNWFWNCIIATITPFMVGDDQGGLGSNVFFVWGTLCIASFFFAYFLVPEMKGLSLEQIDIMLEEVSPRKSRGWQATTTFAAEMGHLRPEKNGWSPPTAMASPVPESQRQVGSGVVQHPFQEAYFPR